MEWRSRNPDLHPHMTENTLISQRRYSENNTFAPSKLKAITEAVEKEGDSNLQEDDISAPPESPECEVEIPTLGVAEEPPNRTIETVINLEMQEELIANLSMSV